MSTFLVDQKNLLSDLINRYRNHVDFLTIRLEEAEGTNILLRRDKVETLSEGISLGGQVRACYKGGWGFAAFNDLATLAERIEEAISAAKIVGEEETLIAPVEVIDAVCELPLIGTSPRQISLANKKALCDRYNQILLTYHENITSTSVCYGDSSQRIIIATSEGSSIEQSWSDMEMRFSATARNGEIVQTGRETTGSRKAYEDLISLESKVEDAAKRAVDALSTYCER